MNHHRDLADLRAYLLGGGADVRLDVILGQSSLHDGYRVWVEMPRHSADRFRAESDWIMWPGGLSLGAGRTVRAALASARRHAPDLSVVLAAVFPKEP